MRIPLLCSDCVEAGLAGKEATVFVPANDNGIYVPTCKRGHTTHVVIVSTRYEQLFEIGLSAISDHYYREAISSFAAALERFYEFTTSVLASSAGIDLQSFSEMWKTVAKQSERQMGVYAAAFLFSEKKTARLLNQNSVELRNAVVHQGKIPTLDQALRFGDAVLDVIRPTLAVLQTKHSEAFHAFSMRQHLEALKTPELRGKKVTRYHVVMALRNLELEDIHGRDTKYYVWRLRSLHGLLE